VCDDAIGNYPNDNALKITHFRGSGGTINAQFVTSGQLYVFDNVPLQRISGDIPANPLMPNVSQPVINRLLGSTGPLTPRVNVPLFIYELKDLPKMLKDTGDYLHGLRKRPRVPSDRDLASQTLAYQFGWGPLIGDIVKMISFTEIVQKRQSELEKASSSRGLKRRITLEPDVQMETANKLVWSAAPLANLRANCTTTHSRETWATVRWTLKPGQSTGKKPTYMEAFNAALGLNRGMIPIDVWKALPWSWAIDWFADISNIMQANYNMIYYSPGSVCIMNRIKSTMVIDPQKHPVRGHVATGGIRVRETLSRAVTSSPSPTLKMKVPFLDAFKLSILGSFTILRIRGRR
jgi:hypothetical protein